jgi:Relaxase/Mobilisation nuclease domain
MSIAKINKGNGFRGVMDYLLNPDKRPRIIGGCVFNSTPAKLAREFRLVANLRPKVCKPVRHFSIAFAPEDGVVDDITKEAIALRVLDGLGYQKCQFIAVDHHRDDPGHDYAHDHDHIHIVTNAVTVEGKFVRDSFDRFKIQTILREAERDFGLREIKSSWEVKREKAQAVNLDADIARMVKDSLDDCPNLQTWLDRLEHSNIDVRFNLSTSDRVTGVTFIKDGEAHKGGDIGSKWSVVSEKIPTSTGDLALMRSTNLKVQGQPVRLSQIDRAMFDRAVEMAMMKLGDGNKFKNCRVGIELDKDNLTVVRMRPDRLMFKARRMGDGKWEPVGWLNIDRKDVEQLERLNGAEVQRFDDVLGEGKDRKKVYKVTHNPRTKESQRLSRGISI